MQTLRVETIGICMIYQDSAHYTKTRDFRGLCTEPIGMHVICDDYAQTL